MSDKAVIKALAEILAALVIVCNNANVYSKELSSAIYELDVCIGEMEADDE
jgi:hypothetical protein